MTESREDFALALAMKMEQHLRIQRERAFKQVAILGK
jgi:hypothetical protein